ncbi:DUF6279 family lipoprotein [Noviherbaspirillum agri]
MQNFIMQGYRAFSLRMCLLVLALALAGCSTVRFGYANGDTFVYWWLNGYVEFTDDQKPWVKGHIDKLLAWHRRTQLKDYARILALVQQRMQQTVSSADVLSEYGTLKKRVLLVLDKATPELTELALSLQPHQIAHLEKKFASNNDKYRREYLRGSLEERQERRYEQVMKQAEYWFGNFSEQQQAQLRAASDARPVNDELWLAERMRRQQELLRLLRKFQVERPTKDAAAVALKNYIAASSAHFTYAENKDFFDASNEGAAQMTALMINIATPEQKAHATKRLQKWIDDFETLARE